MVEISAFNLGCWGPESWLGDYD